MSTSKLNVFKTAIKQNGFDSADFELTEKNLTRWDTPQLVGIPIQGSITVMRKSTQKQKSYATGHGANGLNEFIRDLATGFYN